MKSDEDIVEIEVKLRGEGLEVALRRLEFDAESHPQWGTSRDIRLVLDEVVRLRCENVALTAQVAQIREVLEGLLDAAATEANRVPYDAEARRQKAFEVEREMGLDAETEANRRGT